MSHSSDQLLETNWISAVRNAQMSRVQKPKSGSETITVEKEVFDEIVRIADYVAELRTYGENAEQMESRKTSNGFEVVLRDKVVGDVCAQSGHLLEAMKEAARKRSMALNRLLE